MKEKLTLQSLEKQVNGNDVFVIVLIALFAIVMAGSISVGLNLQSKIDELRTEIGYTRNYIGSVASAQGKLSYHLDEKVTKLYEKLGYEWVPNTMFEVDGHFTKSKVDPFDPDIIKKDVDWESTHCLHSDCY